MAETRRRNHRPRRALAIAVALAAACIVLPTPAGAAPPPSSSLETRWTNLTARSWVGADGLVYTVADYIDRWAPILPEAPIRLVIRRVLADGTGDPSWGTYDGVDGLRLIDGPWPEVGDGTLDPWKTRIATSDDGIVALSWAASCDNARCGRWYLRITDDGTQISEAVRVADVQDEGLALPDATFLDPNPAGDTVWRDGAGAELDVVPVAYATIVDATVDASGRLLLTTNAGRLIRWPAGGPADFDIAISGCANTTTVRLGRSATDDTFATVCDPQFVDTNPATVQRRSTSGSIDWTATPYSDETDGTADRVTSAFVDADDRVWVGAQGEEVSYFADQRKMFLRVFSSNGPGPIAYERRSPRGDSNGNERSGSPGFADLRPGPAGTVVVTDTFRCCVGNSLRSANDSVRTTTVEARTEALPRCAPSNVGIEPVDGATASVTFTGCDAEPIAYRQPTTYDVVITASDGTTDTEVVPATTPGASYQPSVPATAGELTKVAVTASNGAGPNPNEQDTLTADTVTPFRTVEAFVQRQLTDLRNDAPPGYLVGSRSSAIRSGTSPLDVIDAELETGRAAQVIEPVARLYRAYFLRLPDPSGLTYWTGRRDAGRGLHTISESFARSPEFQAYGTLTNRQYVNALYQNIFGRPSDPQGLAYWANKLDTRKTSRGKVVLQFSESAEGKTLLAPYVEPLATTWLMLDRVPTPTEATTWATTTNPHRDVAATILATPEYATTAN